MSSHRANFRCSCLDRADLIRIHDGASTTEPTIAVLCNHATEVEVLSTGPDLYIEFVANSEWPGQGFKAMFQFQVLDDLPNSGMFYKLNSFFSKLY